MDRALGISEVHLLNDRYLGSGAYGEVIEAEWCGTICAAKRMHQIFLQTLQPSDLEKFLQDFLKECQIWSLLRHPNICQFLGNYYPKESRVPIFVVEKMDTSLRRHLEDRGKEDFLLLDKVRVLQQVVQGLTYLHSFHPEPLVHHDLSPNNILLNKYTYITKITDFGMTRAIDRSNLTRQSSIKGTPVFMPPEALSRPLKYDEKLDVFSYGNCIATTLTHQWPDPCGPKMYKDGKTIPLSEFQRRKAQIDMFNDREKCLFLGITEACLSDLSDPRPSSLELVSAMREIETKLKRDDPTACTWVHRIESQISKEREDKSILERDKVVLKNEKAHLEQQVDSLVQLNEELQEKLQEERKEHQSDYLKYRQLSLGQRKNNLKLSAQINQMKSNDGSSPENIGGDYNDALNETFPLTDFDVQMLHKYCQNGNYDRARQLLNDMTDMGSDPSVLLQSRLGPSDSTPLHVAADSGHATILELLIGFGGCVNSKDKRRCTPLHLAVSSGHSECVQVLIQHEADINAQDESGMTLIKMAELGARTNIVRALKSAAVIKAVETNSPKLQDLLHYPIDSFEEHCLQDALIIAIERDNGMNVGKLIIKGRDTLDIKKALAKAKNVRAHAVTAMLMFVQAAYDNDYQLVLTMYGEYCLGYNVPALKEPDFPDIQAAVQRGEVSTTVAVDVARRKKSPEVLKEFLMRTKIYKDSGGVDWYGLRLKELEISWLKRIQWVKQLQLAHNDFTSVPRQMGSYLKNLTWLNLSNNFLKEIPRCLLELPCITELNLSNNKLVEIPEVHEWASCLTILDLSHNELTTLPQYCEAPNLKRLSLSYNKFRQVPLCVCFLTNLQCLELSKNLGISNLPIDMGRLQKLTELNLEGLNNIKDPPRSVRSNAKHCITYLNSKLRSTRGYYRMKLVLVGKQERGKTTLVARLQGKNVRESDNQSTVGIDVSEWKFTPRFGKQSFTFNIWDFGGQEEYYATHQCFLTERSLYLLVWNITHGEEGVAELKPWLDNIALRAPNSRVIIVATFYDKVPEADREPGGKAQMLLQKVADLAGEYGNKKLQVQRVTFVGLHGKQDNLENLKKVIYEEAEAYEIKGDKVMGRSIPASYHALDTRLTEIKNEVSKGKQSPIMHFQEFKEMVQNRKLADIVSDEEIKTVTLFLHEVGSLLHYDDRKNNLDDLYFVDPRWLCDMMSTVVTIHEKNPYINNGIIQRTALPLLYKGKQFSTKYLEQYLVLMDRFEITLPLDHKKSRILIPSMLPSQKPADISPPNDEVYSQRYILFSVPSPPGYWSRLLARIMHAIPCIKELLEQPTTQGDSPSEEPVTESESITSSGISKFIPQVITERLSKRKKTAGSNSLLNSPDSSLSPSYKEKVLTRSHTSCSYLSTEDVNNLISSEVHENEPPKPTISSPQIVSPLSEPVIESGDTVLKYWRTGICYNNPSLYFCVQEAQGSVGPDKYGVNITVTRSVEGRQVYGQVVDLVTNLIDSWYPGHKGLTGNGGLQQITVCHQCLVKKINPPHTFNKTDLVEYLNKKETHVPCPKGHAVSLVELAPDLLLADINEEFLLEENELHFERDESHSLGKGGYSTVYRGRCRNRSVAIKLFASDSMKDPLDGLIQLRNEAQVLHQNFHPSRVSMVGVLVFPYPALVMEEAPMGSLDNPLLKKKDAISRVVLFRIATQIASALECLHKLSFIYRDLKSANVLLWSLGLDDLINCKLTDFGITAMSAPIGIRGTHGTVGYTAPEVSYVGASGHATYDCQADIFSFAMTLYEMITREHPFFDTKPINISGAVAAGKRPRLNDYPVSKTGLHYLTQLMRRCWKKDPSDRPQTTEIRKNLSKPRAQLLMGIQHVESEYSLRAACCYISVPEKATMRGGAYNDPPSVELWICSDNVRGAEISIFEASNMTRVKHHKIEDNQVRCLVNCGNNVWVASRSGLEFGVVDIYNATTHNLVHRVGMRDTTVSCITSNDSHIFLGTMEGYVFMYKLSLTAVSSDEKPERRYLTENCIEGLAVTPSHLWVSHTKQILLCELNNLEIKSSLSMPEGVKGYIGQLKLNEKKTILWSVHLGGFSLCAWSTTDKNLKFFLNLSDQLLELEPKINHTDTVITAMCPALDTIWCGMASGHILLFSEEKEFLLCLQPYRNYVSFLEVIPASGPCGSEDCMVVSGGKGYMQDDYLEGFNEDPMQAATKEDPGPSKKDSKPPAGTVILWEALKACYIRQIRILSEGDAWTSHEKVKEYRGEWEMNCREVKHHNPEPSPFKEATPVGAVSMEQVEPVPE